MLNIHARVKHLKQKYETSNPELIAAYLGIKVYYENFAKDTKGFYINLIKNKFIIINSNLNNELKNVVLAHELGHALLHYSKSVCFIREYTLFPRGIHENEANKFAAELLINEGNIDKHSIKDMNIDQLSCYFKVPKLLVKLKFNKYFK